MDSPMTETTRRLTIGVYFTLALLLFRAVYLVIYRLYFHPLRQFPGPKLAICTYLYENYYEIVRQGQYTFKLRELHDIYGPIIRLNPDELHCNDPDFYHEIFSTAGAKANKAQFFRDAFGPLEMVFGTVEHDLHHMRRNALIGHFTKRSIGKLAPYISATVQKLCDRFQDASKTGEIINLQNAYSSLAEDTIYEYCFSSSQNTISIPNFNAESHDYTIAFVKQLCMDTVLKVLSPGYGKVLDDQKRLGRKIEDIKSSEYGKSEVSGHTTVFHALLNSDLPPKEKSSLRLRDEAFTLLLGGTTTTAHTLKIITYNLLANPNVCRKLMDELESKMPHSTDVPSLQTLEQSPYLTAVIHEALRYSTGLSHRLWRSYPQKTLQYKGLDIPPGTIISATAMLIHENPSIFTDPHAFKPERWLGEDAQHLRRYFIPFSRGTRRCVGESLAYAEMYFTVAIVFRRFEFELYDVVRERDIDCARDAFVPVSKPESKGVRVKVIGVK